MDEASTCSSTVYLSEVLEDLKSLKMSLNKTLVELHDVPDGDCVLNSTQQQQQLSQLTNGFLELKEEVSAISLRMSDLARTQVDLQRQFTNLAHTFGPRTMGGTDCDSGIATAQPTFDSSETNSVGGVENRNSAISSEVGYESDSSLMRTANRSLFLCDNIERRLRFRSSEILSSDESENDNDDECTTASEGEDSDSRADIQAKHVTDSLHTSLPISVENNTQALLCNNMAFALQSHHCSSNSSCKTYHNSLHKSVTVSEVITTNPRIAGYSQFQRRCLLEELLDTERRYCNGLWNTQENFCIPLSRSGLISTKDLRIIFPAELLRIYQQHCFLLHKLQERLSTWDSSRSTIGDVFVKFFDADTDVLLLYNKYISDFPRLLKTVQKCLKKSSKVRRFLLDSCRVNTVGTPNIKMAQTFQLDSFLLTPIQRIPRYVLLLKQLLKHTTDDNPDKQFLEFVLDRLHCFLLTINNSMDQSLSASLSSSSCKRPVLKQKKKNGAFRCQSNGLLNIQSSNDVNGSNRSTSGKPSTGIRGLTTNQQNQACQNIRKKLSNMRCFDSYVFEPLPSKPSSFSYISSPSSFSFGESAPHNDVSCSELFKAMKLDVPKSNGVLTPVTSHGLQLANATFSSEPALQKDIMDSFNTVSSVAAANSVRCSKIQSLSQQSFTMMTNDSSCSKCAYSDTTGEITHDVSLPTRRLKQKSVVAKNIASVRTSIVGLFKKKTGRHCTVASPKRQNERCRLEAVASICSCNSAFPIKDNKRTAQNLQCSSCSCCTCGRSFKQCSTCSKDCCHHTAISDISYVPPPPIPPRIRSPNAQMPGEVPSSSSNHNFDGAGATEVGLTSINLEDGAEIEEVDV